MELTDKDYLNIGMAVTSSQVAAEIHEETKFTTFYKGNIKRLVNLSNKELIKVAKNFDVFVNGSELLEAQTDQLFNMNYDVSKKLAQIGIINFYKVLEVLEAFEKNENKLLGTARRINKN